MVAMSSVVPALSAALSQLVQSEIEPEQLPVLIFRQRVNGPDWLRKFKWWDESNKQRAIAVSQTIIELNALGLYRQIEFELQKLAQVFFRDSMAHFEVAVTEMEKWGEIAGVRNWEKEFVWFAPKDYPLAMPAEAIRRLQIILELSRQGVPVGDPWIVVRKMYHPPNANLVAEMGGWFLVQSWLEGEIESSFRTLKIRRN